MALFLKYLDEGLSGRSRVYDGRDPKMVELSVYNDIPYLSDSSGDQPSQG